MSLPLKIALTAIGTRGDVQPVVALAQTLRQRGHTVRIGAPPDFGEWVTGMGFEFVPVGVDMRVYMREHPDLLTGSPLRIMKSAQAFFWQEVPAHVRDMTPLIEWCDVVAMGGLGITALHLAEHLHRPSLTLIYSTCMLQSDSHAPPNIPRHDLPRWLNRMLWSINRLASDWIAGRPINQARAAMGLPAVSIREHLMTHGTRVVAADPHLFPHDPSWGAAVQPANFIQFDDPTALDPALQAWIDEGEPPVFVGFGSMSGQEMQHVDQVLREALGGLGRRCLIGAGWAQLGASGLPAGWRVVNEAPHALLFPQMAAVVHHGGSGTTANALRAGVPQLILPLILDQYYHAHCLHRAGLMPPPVSLKNVTATQLAQGIRHVMALPAGPLREIADRLTRHDGRDTIVRALEALVPDKPAA